MMDVEKVIARGLVLFHQLPPGQLRQLSGEETTSVESMFFQCPFEHQPWPSVAKPILKDVPALPSRRSRGGKKVNYVLGSWQTSIVVTTVAVGVVAVASAYAFRDRIGMRM